jgi:hypothetical protein
VALSKMPKPLHKIGFICFCLKFSTPDTDEENEENIWGGWGVALQYCIFKQYDVDFLLVWIKTTRCSS